MTDPAPALPETSLPPLAITHERLLRHIAEHGAPRNHKALGETLGLNSKNFARDFGRLAEEGLLTLAPYVAVTDAARRALSALDLYAGRFDVAPGVEQTGPEALPDGYAFLPLDRIAPHPLNPRKDFDSDAAIDALDELRESIVLAGGIRQNLEVRPADANGVHFIIAGERRWRAATAAQADGDLPADYRVLCLVKAVDDEQHLLDALDENFARQDLHPVDEAAAYHFMRHTLDLSTAQIAEKVRRSQKHVQDYLKLNALDDTDKARMRLPADDPRSLSYTQARHLLQEHRPPSPPPAARSPLDDPKTLLMLVEIAHACVWRPTAVDRPLAQATRTHISRGFDSSREDQLAKAGLIELARADGGVRVIILTSKGADELTRRGLHPGNDGTALYAARLRAGHANITIQDHDKADLYFTEQLNGFGGKAAVAVEAEAPSEDQDAVDGGRLAEISTPRSPPAPEPISLSSTAALALAELAHLCWNPIDGRWDPVPVGAYWRHQDASDLVAAGMVRFEHGPGHPSARMAMPGEIYLQRTLGLPPSQPPLAIGDALAGLRQAAGLPDQNGGPSTPWLTPETAAETAPSALAELTSVTIDGPADDLAAMLQESTALPGRVVALDPPIEAGPNPLAQPLAELRDAATEALKVVFFFSDLDPEGVSRQTLAEMIETANAVRGPLQLALMAANFHLPRKPTDPQPAPLEEAV